MAAKAVIPGNGLQVVSTAVFRSPPVRPAPAPADLPRDEGKKSRGFSPRPGCFYTVSDKASDDTGE